MAHWHSPIRIEPSVQTVFLNKSLIGEYFMQESGVYYLTDASLKPIGVATIVVKGLATLQWCNQLEWDLPAWWLSWKLTLVSYQPSGYHGD